MNWLVKIIGKGLALFAGLFTARQWGKETQKRKQAEADIEVLKDHAKIDSRPDLNRSDLYSRLRGKK